MNTEWNRTGLLANREQAGTFLAEALKKYSNRPDCLVLGLPRGGVVVAYEVATRLCVPLDVCVVRKLGVPYEPELAMGALAMGGVVVLDQATIRMMEVSEADIERTIQDERLELERREIAFRGSRDFPCLGGKTVILVDDGLATGATAEAAIRAIRTLGASRVVLAVGVAAGQAIARFEGLADEVISILCPENMESIGAWYGDFSQTPDSQVRELLERAAKKLAASATGTRRAFAMAKGGRT